MGVVRSSKMGVEGRELTVEHFRGSRLDTGHCINLESNISCILKLIDAFCFVLPPAPELVGRTHWLA